MWCIHTVELTQPLLEKKLHFISLDKSNFHITDNLLIAAHTFASRILMPFSVDKMLLPRYVNFFTDFREPTFSMEMSPFLSKHIYSVLSAFTRRLLPHAACSRLCSRDSAWVGVFAGSVTSST